MAVLDVGLLRRLLRNMQEFRALREAEGIDVIRDLDGTEWCLDDLEYLCSAGLPLLPPRQRQAIELCLIGGIREVDAAVRMGVSPTNPVAMYATLGLEKIVTMVYRGELPRFQRGLYTPVRLPGV